MRIPLEKSKTKKTRRADARSSWKKGRTLTQEAIDAGKPAAGVDRSNQDLVHVAFREPSFGRKPELLQDVPLLPKSFLHFRGIPRPDPGHPPNGWAGRTLRDSWGPRTFL